MPDYRVPKCVEVILAGVEAMADVVVPHFSSRLRVEAAILHAACDQRVPEDVFSGRLPGRRGAE
eukprot:CAMPEP_0172584562 /NCGR_PEP_ID=MMETSP1068-20121228/4175_1 /TAXON_ID=35684 /ORGANISM="Pseudopedinella elastica, Strain CCMP716" /LENGTH=63 /DNA_ID=CAMNT_0013378791 /DNA_START=9 /DNA_END=200 /DNA_ORIENTATION=-